MAEGAQRQASGSRDEKCVIRGSLNFQRRCRQLLLRPLFRQADSFERFLALDAFEHRKDLVQRGKAGGDLAEEEQGVLVDAAAGAQSLLLRASVRQTSLSSLIGGGLRLPAMARNMTERRGKRKSTSC